MPDSRHDFETIFEDVYELVFPFPVPSLECLVSTPSTKLPPFPSEAELEIKVWNEIK